MHLNATELYLNDLFKVRKVGIDHTGLFLLEVQTL